MSGVWGNKVKYSIFGESHGSGIGIVIDGLPPGIKLDFDVLRSEMNRRKPGSSNITTSRKEEDQYEIVSGLFNDYTTGAPFCAFIQNTSQRSGDYEQQRNYFRPSHADYTAYVKSNGFNDYRGGGHFSGRLTAPIVFAGAVAKQLLASSKINIFSHILSIGSEKDISFMDIDISELNLTSLKQSEFPTIKTASGDEMKKIITSVKANGDSIGGVIECAAVNLPVGIGAPFFDSLESTLSHLVFSIPGVKGIEFGDGFEISTKKGSEANDQYYICDRSIKTMTNHNGGILGGLSTGMPLIFKAAFKPTPSIATEQSTVNIHSMEDSKISVIGRHDPCIVPRAIPVIEAVTAMAILEHIR